MYLRSRTLLPLGAPRLQNLHLLLGLYYLSRGQFIFQAYWGRIPEACITFQSRTLRSKKLKIGLGLI